MNDFKEWLSDNLRYFILAFVVIAVIGAAIYGVNLYSKAVGGNGNQPKETQEDTKKQSESQKETETDSEKETDKKETEKESETQKGSESEARRETEGSSESGQAEESQTGESTAEGNQTEETIAAEAPVPETQPVQTEPSEPVYLSINSACYMRSAPDYGDNIIGQYEAGTTVQFLEDVGGWYRVQVNGVTGYMGARFFN